MAAREKARLLSEVHVSPTLILGKEMSVLEAAELMASARTNAGIVQDATSGALVGILTDSDVSIKVIASGLCLSSTLVCEVMTPRPLCCYADESATHALGVMASKRARHLPLLDAGGAVYGMLDITKVLYDAIAVLEERKRASSASRFWFQAERRADIPSLADALRGRPPPATCAPGDALRVAFEGLTRTRRSVLVLDGEARLVGILSKSDVARCAISIVRGGGAVAKIGDLEVRRAMTSRPDHVSGDRTVLDALHRMHDGKHASLPVLDADSKPLGVVDVLDVINATDVHEGGGTDWLGDLFATQDLKPKKGAAKAGEAPQRPPVLAAPSDATDVDADVVDAVVVEPLTPEADLKQQQQDAPLPAGGGEGSRGAQLRSTAEVRASISPAALVSSQKTALAALAAYVLSSRGESVRVEASDFTSLSAAALQAFGFDADDVVNFVFEERGDRILVDNDKKLTAVGHVHEAGDLHLAVVSVSPKSTGATVHKVLALLAVAGVAAAALRRRA